MRGRVALVLLLAARACAQNASEACLQAIEAQEWVLEQYTSTDPQMAELLLEGMESIVSDCGCCASPQGPASARGTGQQHGARGGSFRAPPPLGHPGTTQEPAPSVLQQAAHSTCCTAQRHRSRTRQLAPAAASCCTLCIPSPPPPPPPSGLQAPRPFQDVGSWFDKQTSWSNYNFQALLSSAPWGGADYGEGEPSRTPPLRAPAGSCAAAMPTAQPRLLPPSIPPSPPATPLVPRLLRLSHPAT